MQWEHSDDLAVGDTCSDAAFFGGGKAAADMSGTTGSTATLEVLERGMVSGDGPDLAEGLWRRAAAAGARTVMERKAFAISDDMYGLVIESLKCWS